MKQLRRWTTILGLTLLALPAATATADHERRSTRPGYDRPGAERPDSDRSVRRTRRGDHDSDRDHRRSGRSRAESRAVALAHELEDASRHAADVTDRRRGDRAVTDGFHRLGEAARQLAHSMDRNGHGGEREFDRVVARYYELRGDFSRYHGPQDVRAAFHRVNRPMEELYRMYTGRDLYRDDPNRGNGRHGRHRGYDRHDDHRHDDDRWDRDRRDRRDDRGARDTRTRIPRRN